MCNSESSASKPLNSRLAARAQEAYKRIWVGVDYVVQDHLGMLLHERDKALHRGTSDQGEKQRWAALLSKFYENTVLPDLHARGMAAEIDILNQHWALNECDDPDVMKYKVGSGSMEYFALIACRHITDKLDKQFGLRTKLAEDAVHSREAIFDAAREVVAQHLDALLVKRRKTLYRDDYGRVITDQWVKEVVYFYDNILMPELYSRGLGNRVAELELHWVLNESETPDIKGHLLQNGNIGGYLEEILCLLMFDVLEAVESDGSVDPGGNTDVSRMSPNEYELYCARELNIAGWDCRVVAGAGDQGVDIAATKGNTKAVFQCKLYSSPLGNSPVQEVHAGRTFYGAGIAAVVSNAEFTPGGTEQQRHRQACFSCTIHNCEPLDATRQRARSIASRLSRM